jgi:peptidoglycan/xylan/chitin deacetylase (PgdA/CDA1 family)
MFSNAMVAMKLLIFCSATAVLLAGCSSGGSTSTEAPPAASATAPKSTSITSAAPVTDRPANHNGSIFVAMYHHLGAKKDPFFRTAEQFQSDLERMDKMGWRPITATDYLSDKMNLAPGATPVVMTFDDANADQLQLLPGGTIDPNCFLGIWQTFAKTHPEFPIRATFFILPDSMFGKKADRETKVKLLKDLGCELANHTITHPSLKSRSDAQVEDELGEAAERLTQMGATVPGPMALPFGISPKNKSLLRGFSWHGQNVSFTGVFLVGANPAPPVDSKKFNRYAIPRIQANDGELGLTYWLNLAKSGRVKVYVQ